MDDTFKTISSAFEEAGVAVATAEYSITEYSLNTSLSFRFENIHEFLKFLDINDRAHERKAEEISTMLINSAINPESFFYVNFYEPKVAEL